VRYLKLIAATAAGCVFAAGSLRAQLPTGSGLMDFGLVGHGPYTFAKSLAGLPTLLASGVGRFNKPTDPYAAKFDLVRTPGHNDPLPFNVDAGTFGPTYDVFCVSLLNGITFGESNIPIYATNIGSDAAAIGNYTRPHTLTQYLEAAWLSTRIESFTGVTAPLMRAEYTGAIWQAMDGAGVIGYFWNGTTWINLAPIVALANAQATGAWGAANKDFFVVATPQDACGPAVGLPVGKCSLHGGTQEMLVHVTPEPATMLLLGTGLMVMLFGAAVRRRPLP
jgi:hypothetical protein